MRAGEGFGVAALILAIVGMFMPLVGLFIGWFALALACLAALFGDRGFTIATVAISMVAFAFFTPSLWVGMAAAEHGATRDAAILSIVSLAALAAPVVCIVLNATGRLALRRR